MTGHDRGSPVGLHTDLYELRMAESYLARGMTEDATFSLFVRPTPLRPWFVAMGAGRVVEFLEAIRYGPTELAYLRELGFREDTLDRLEALEPTGTLVAAPEGTVVLANEPLLEFTAPLPVAQLVETAVINLVQYPTLVATKAARVRIAAGDADVADFGFRRAHGLETGIEAARVAWVGGGIVTSNVEAGRRHGIPVVGTMAHAYVQSFDEEIDAFRSFAADHPENAILLVDTYDTLGGVAKAIEVGREMRERGDTLRGVRLDSGDLATLAVEARRMLDEAGFEDVRIFASGGLDEHRVGDLANAPVDAFGVGTSLVTSKDLPALDIVYKMVEYGGVGRAKASTDKATLPGRKQVFRSDGPPSDVLGLRDEDLDGATLLEPIWQDGNRLVVETLEDIRDRARRELDALPEAWRDLRWEGDPPVPELSPGLRATAGR